MKTNLTLSCLAAILLVGITALASAQDAEAQRKAREAQRSMMRSPVMKRSMEHSMRQSMLSNWDNQMGIQIFGLIHTDGNAEVLGISEGQRQKLMDSFTKITISSDDPDYKPFFEEMGRLHTETPGGLFGENASEEAQMKYFDLQMRMQEVTRKKQNDVVAEILTPDHVKKLQEYQIASMTGNPFITPNMFEALDLSGDQKDQLEEIKKGLKPEYEKIVDKWVTSQQLYQEKVQDEIGDQLDNVSDPEERKRISMEVSKKVAEKYPDISSGMKEFAESGKVLSDKLKFSMFDVLTDEQMERMTQLINNPPDHVMKIRENFRKEYEKRQNAMGTAAPKAADEWTPGPDSWKPGDGIPEGYMEHREEQRRFPRRQ